MEKTNNQNDEVMCKENVSILEDLIHELSFQVDFLYGNTSGISNSVHRIAFMTPIKSSQEESKEKLKEESKDDFVTLLRGKIQDIRDQNNILNHINKHLKDVV